MILGPELPLELSQCHNFLFSFKALSAPFQRNTQTLILLQLLLRLSLQLLVLLKAFFLALPDLFGQQVVLLDPLNE